METDGPPQRPGFWRRFGRRVRAFFEALDFLEFLVAALRFLTAPFRLLASLLDALW